MGTILDIIILAICVFLGIRGLFNGFVREILSLVAFIVGFFAVVYFRVPFSQWMIIKFGISSIIATVLSSIILFVVAYVLVKIIEASLSRFVNIILLSELNRIAGCIVGIFKGVIIIYFIVYLIQVQSIFPTLAQQLNFSSSKLLPWVELISAWLVDVINV